MPALMEYNGAIANGRRPTVNKFLASVLLTLLFGVIILVAVLVLTLGFTGIGWIVNRAFGLGLLPATAIALAVALGTGALLYQVLYRVDHLDDHEEEDWDDDWGEEWLEDLQEPGDKGWDKEDIDDEEDAGPQPSPAA